MEDKREERRVKGRVCWVGGRAERQDKSGERREVTTGKSELNAGCERGEIAKGAVVTAAEIYVKRGKLLYTGINREKVKDA